MLQSGDYVVNIRGVDDVSDGQLCRVMAPDESSRFYRFPLEEWVPVLCWTGYIAWTTQENLIEVAGDDARLGQLFRCGFARSGSAPVRF